THAWRLQRGRLASEPGSLRGAASTTRIEARNMHVRLIASCSPTMGEFHTLTHLHAALDRVYKLAVSLPDAPLARFQAVPACLPRTTDAEVLVLQRFGPD